MSENTLTTYLLFIQNISPSLIGWYPPDNATKPAIASADQKNNKLTNPVFGSRITPGLPGAPGGPGSPAGPGTPGRPFLPAVPLGPWMYWPHSPCSWRRKLRLFFLLLINLVLVHITRIGFSRYLSALVANSSYNFVNQRLLINSRHVMVSIECPNYGHFNERLSKQRNFINFIAQKPS